MCLEVRCGPWHSDRRCGPQRAFSREVVTDEGGKLAINAELVLATESGLGPRPMPGSKERAIRPDRASVGTGRVQRVRDDLPVPVRENCCPQTDAGASACVRARPCGQDRKGVVEGKRG